MLFKCMTFWVGSHSWGWHRRRHGHLAGREPSQLWIQHHQIWSSLWCAEILLNETKGIRRQHLKKKSVHQGFHPRSGDSGRSMRLWREQDRSISDKVISGVNDSKWAERLLDTPDNDLVLDQVIQCVGNMNSSSSEKPGPDSWHWEEGTSHSSSCPLLWAPHRCKRKVAIPKTKTNHQLPGMFTLLSEMLLPPLEKTLTCL